MFSMLKKGIIPVLGLSLLASAPLHASDREGFLGNPDDLAHFLFGRTISQAFQTTSDFLNQFRDWYWDNEEENPLSLTDSPVDQSLIAQKKSLAADKTEKKPSPHLPQWVQESIKLGEAIQVDLPSGESMKALAIRSLATPQDDNDFLTCGLKRMESSDSLIKENDTAYIFHISSWLNAIALDRPVSLTSILIDPIEIRVAHQYFFTCGLDSHALTDMTYFNPLTDKPLHKTHWGFLFFQDGSWDTRWEGSSGNSLDSSNFCENFSVIFMDVKASSVKAHWYLKQLNLHSEIVNHMLVISRRVWDDFFQKKILATQAK